MEVRAKRAGKQQAKTVEFWFRRKYGLTKSDPRYLDLTTEDLLEDYWAHHFYDNPKAADADEDEEFDLDKILSEIEAGADDWEDVP